MRRAAILAWGAVAILGCGGPDPAAVRRDAQYAEAERAFSSGDADAAFARLEELRGPMPFRGVDGALSDTDGPPTARATYTLAIPPCASLKRIS